LDRGTSIDRQDSKSKRISKSKSKKLKLLVKKKKKSSRTDKLHSLSFSLITEEDFAKTFENIFVKKESYEGWVLIGYESEKKLTFQGSGTYVETLLEFLDDNQIQYILIRLPIKKSNQTTSRDVFIYWSGPQVSLVERAKKNIFLAEIKDMLRTYHADLTAISKSHFTVETILDRSDPLSGSHVID